MSVGFCLCLFITKLFSQKDIFKIKLGGIKGVFLSLNNVIERKLKFDKKRCLLIKPYFFADIMGFMNFHL